MHRDAGFTLIETLAGLTFVSLVTASLVSLIVMAGGLARDAHDDSTAVVLASQKLESLRAAFTAGATLPFAAVDALQADVPELSDRVDGYVRRWRVGTLTVGSSSLHVLQVRVLAARRAADLPGEAPPPARVPGEVVLSTVVGPRP